VSKFSGKFRGERDYDDEQYFREENKNKKRQKQQRKQKYYDEYESFESQQRFNQKPQKMKHY